MVTRRNWVVLRNGVNCLQNRTVIITGAGFSVPAKLPIQNEILKEMTQPMSRDFLIADENDEGVKFMLAYIKVALYLLKEYSNCDVDIIERSHIKLEIDYLSDSRVQEVLRYIEETKVVEAQQKDYNLNRVIEDVLDKYGIDDNRYFYTQKFLESKIDYF